MRKILSFSARDRRVAGSVYHTLSSSSDARSTSPQDANIAAQPVLVAQRPAQTLASPGELRRLIRHLIVDDEPDYVETAREICVRTFAGESLAQEAAAVILDYISAPNVLVCLRAIQLWAIMLRYCPSKRFVRETSRDAYLESIKRIYEAPDTDQRVRSRLSEVISGAVDTFPAILTFRALWRSMKRPEDPEEGVRFSNPLFFLPNTHRAFVGPDVDPLAHVDLLQRLVVSCELAESRARDLNRILNTEDLYIGCIVSRTFIQSQIPWATVNAERSIHHRAGDSADSSHPQNDTKSHTFEEQLLGMLLRANQELNNVILRRQVDAVLNNRDAPGPIGPRPSPPPVQGAPAAYPEPCITIASSPLPAHVEEPRHSATRGVEVATAPRPPSLQIPPPPYAESQRADSTLRLPPALAEAGAPTDECVDIGHALPQSVLSYLRSRSVPRETLYDVELALDGSQTREWLAALAEIPGLTATDRKAIALLNRRALSAGSQR
ncbi:hypothetical protein AURDEDRAFT_172370 [Auricularia subglabra TFB-10046 SS5]|nr:hypothetical protein AURDEDRAFT_172370 [Auricularia subglabra TFB-10046 SS5]